MNLVTRLTNKLRMMKTPRRTILAASLLTMTASSVMVTTKSALATREPCYSRNGYSFQYETLVNDNVSTNNIFVWRGGSCSGSPIMEGSASYNHRSRQVTIEAKDLKCDRTGLTLYTVDGRGPNVSSGGCRQPGSATLNASSFKKPHKFWVYVAGTTNSNAHNLPIR
ncbi:hypothetical protein H6F89_29185 [Cyanobacteria bacterium FACHB-63]|nr:hypothetical protein [Cyanobacteria bacterium FACHB-63]